MKNNVPIVIYRNWLATFTALPSEAVGDIIKALSVHVITGSDPVLSDELEVLKNQLFNEVDEGLEKYYAKCAKNKQIADEREAKKAEERHEGQTNVERTCAENEKDDTRTCGNSKTKTKTKTNNSSREELEKGTDKPTRSRFVPPTLEELRTFITENNLNVNPEGFMDCYTANGWKVGKNSMKDWKATARNWDRRSKEYHVETVSRVLPNTQDSVTDWDKIAKEVEQLGYFDNGNNHANVLSGIPATIREDVGG